jgi:hypothetical protein
MNRKFSDLTMMKNKTNVVPMLGGEPGYVINARVSVISGKNVTLVFGMNSEEQRTVEGRVAFSCLVAPQVGDVVVCVQNDTGIHIVLGIVERPDDGPSSQDITLSFPANASLHCPAGDLGLSAKDKVSVVAGESLICAADKTIHKSHDALIDYENTTARGNRFTAKFDSMYLLSDVITTMAKQALHKFNHYVRRSSESDQVSAAQMDRKVDGLYSMNSSTTLMISTKDTKIDGERIHMG